MSIYVFFSFEDNVDRKPPAKSFQLVPFRDHSAGNSIGSSPQLGQFCADYLTFLQ